MCPHHICTTLRVTAGAHAPRYSRQVDWLQLLTTVGLPALSIVATAGVALGVKAMDLRARNAERRHEVARGLDTRMWDAKRAALEAISGSCVRIRQQCRQVDAQGSNKHEIEHRTGVLCVLVEECKEIIAAPGGRGAVIAWVEEPTRHAIEWLFNVIDAELVEHRSALGSLRAATELQGKVIRVLPEDVGDPETRKGIDDFKTYNDMAGGLTQDIGSGSKLDLNALADLCDKVIREARDDLRGQHGPAVVA